MTPGVRLWGFIENQRTEFWRNDGRTSDKGGILFNAKLTNSLIRTIITVLGASSKLDKCLISPPLEVLLQIQTTA